MHHSSPCRHYGLTPKLFKQMGKCDEENKQREFECSNEYLVAKTGCSPMKTSSEIQSNLLGNCSSIEEVREYLLNVKKLSNGTAEGFECHEKKNCLQFSWQPELKYLTRANVTELMIYDQEVNPCTLIVLQCTC